MPEKSPAKATEPAKTAAEEVVMARPALTRETVQESPVGTAAPKEAAAAPNGDATAPMNAAAEAALAQELEAKALAVVKNHSIVTMGISVIPIPIIDILGQAGLQLKMVKEIAEVYNVPFQEDLGKSIVAAFASGYGSMVLAGKAGWFLAGSIPGFGLAATLALRPLLTGGSTYAMGLLFIRHFASGGTLLDFDIDRAKTALSARFFPEDKKPSP